MRSLSFIALFFLILIALGIVTASFSQNSFAQDSSSQDRSSQDSIDKLIKLKSQIAKTTKSLNRFKDKQAKEYRLLQLQEETLAQLVSDIEATNLSIDNSNKTIQQLDRRRQQLLPLKRQQAYLVRQELQSAYRMGQQDQIKLLLNQENPELMARMLRYYQYITAARSQKIQQFLDTMNEISQLKSETESEQAKQVAWRQQLQDKLSKAEQAKQLRKLTVTQLQNQINDTQSQLVELNRSYKQLEELIQSVAEAMVNIEPQEEVEPFSRQKGKLPAPIKGKVLNRYGSQRAGSLKWQGVTIAAVEGSEVKAIHYGRVVFSGYLRGYGLLTIIDHDDNYMSLYGHNQVLRVNVGDWVTPKQVIALAGNTGGQLQPSLYFEVRHNNRPQNPFRWVR